MKTDVIQLLGEGAAGLDAEAFRRYAEELTDFFENAAVGLHWVNQDGIIVWANRAELEMLGYEAGEYIGHRISEFHADERVIVDILDRLGRGETLSGYEARLRRKDGTIRYVSIASNVRWRGGKFVHTRCFTTDITERKLLEERLRESEARLRRAQQAGRLGTWDWNVRTNDLVWDGVEEVHGVEPGSFGGSFEAYLADMHPEDQPRVLASINAAVETAGELDVEYRIVPPDGDVRWVAGKGRAFPGDDGRTERMLGTCQDITSRKLAELRLHESMVELEAANAAKDEFLGLVSHELKTPITTVLGNASVLAARIDDLPRETRDESLRDIRTEAERLFHIIDDMLVLARLEAGGEVEREPALVQRLVARVVADHRKRNAHRVINIAIAGDLRPVPLAERYVEQIIRNLVGNAEKYSPRTGPIDVSAEIVGQELMVSVGDRGPGVPADQLGAIFSPFFRAAATAGRAPGVGVGLAVCKRLVEAQSGRIWAELREGGGLICSFALPVGD